jgi:(5-formylfuran-3-yl)methyl phosphate synthase
MDLLVSVRSAAEAEAALEGGAAVIDVKEPANGPLGRAGDETIAAVVRRVAGRRPVSAALGELLRQPAPYAGGGLSYMKWGLAGCGGKDWQGALGAAIRRAGRQVPGCRVVPVAYADWQRAGAPPVDEVVAFVRRRPGSVLLLDTCEKEPGRTLLDSLPVSEVARLVGSCRAAGVRVALAGSLGPEQIRDLLPLRPDWFAVRGAACAGSDRRQAVSAGRVRALVGLLGVIPAARPAS